MTDDTTNTEQSPVAADCPNERLVRRKEKLMKERLKFKIAMLTYRAWHPLVFVVLTPTPRPKEASF